MPNKHLTADKARELVIDCYQSGLTAKQWMIENGINSSTFYKWVKRLRAETSGLDIPSGGGTREAVIPYKQDVVQVAVVSDEDGQAVSAAEAEAFRQYSRQRPADATVTVRFAGADVLIGGNVSQQSLTAVFRSLRDALC